MKAARVAGGLTMAVFSLILVGCAETSDPVTKHLDVTTLDEKATVFEIVDLGKTGFGAGDQLVEDAPLVDADGKPLGKTVTTVAVVSGTGMPDMEGVINCTVELPDGNVLFEGAFEGKDLGAGATLPVTGGTGKYAGASGVVKMIAPSDKKTELKIDLTLPK
jgi:hypothetical protein